MVVFAGDLDRGRVFIIDEVKWEVIVELKVLTELYEVLIDFGSDRAANRVLSFDQGMFFTIQ